ncbi:hypothetical protein CXB51_021138 [Gossypium anomalum]|uniref:Integrase catalytic domain-containing protein n=1 Tax=Gossypium anomalum TaxID=47600 RepID=A0A8J5ZBM3_9ROSI|nr:hypothetical protein CXB51_021138 [Gossypium anomalum]
MAVVNSIRLLGEQFEEVRIVEKVLSTLPERYEAKISSLEDSRDLTRISLTELINALYAQEQRRASRIDEHQEGAFQAKSKPSSSNAAYKGKKNWRDKSKTDASRKWDRPCRHCKRAGHPEARCWFRPDAICQHCKKRGHVESDSEEQVFAVSCLATKGKVKKGWLLDSGCTNHMSPDVTIFKTLDRSYKTRVKIGDGHCIQAEGIGDVIICTPSGNKLIPNVLFVPEIDRNLLSIAQLLEKGYTVVFKGKECQISYQKGSILMTVPMSDKSFIVDWNKDLESAYAASIEESKLWHQRLGHANYRPMARMINKDMAENFIKSVQNEDVYETESLNGSRYFILFIDDSTRYCWIYFLKSKAEVVQAFLKFKTVAETETGYKLRSIRPDNGTEYISAQFQDICARAGIKHQLTNVYTPQQNGTSTQALEQMTPFEAWFGFKPSLAHLRIFGCLCYSQVPAVKRSKLDKRAQVGILVGYSSEKKGYRILDPSTNKVFASRDVVFNERTSWNWDTNEPEVVFEDLMVDQTEPEENGPEMDFDDVPIRGTRSLAEIYERAHIALVEPSCFEEAVKHEGRKQAMADEISMIEKNQTWELVEKPANRKIIGWNVYQLDVKSAFLNGILEEEIYVEQPEGFEVPGNEDMVYKLRKALYGLKQAPRAWYARIDSYLLNLKFERSASEPTLYVKKNKIETQLVVSLYVDDLLVTGGDEVDLAEFKTKMKQMFEMTDLGLMTYFLGMEVNQTQGGICLKQESFALKVLTKFSMLNCKPTPTPVVAGAKLSSLEGHEEVCETTYRSLIGCLLYLTATRPDIMFAAAELRLKGYTDSDWAGFKDDIKSTSGYAFTLGSAMVCSSSKKQSLVAQSTAEAEYVAAASVVNQAIWLRKILADLNLIQEEATEILCDNKSAVAIAKNPVFHGRTKHFDIKLHVIREMEQACEIKLVHCNSEDQIADILTKGLGVSRFNKLRKLMGVCSMELKEEC